MLKRGVEVATCLRSLAVWGGKEQTTHAGFNLIYLRFVALHWYIMHHITERAPFFIYSMHARAPMQYDSQPIFFFLFLVSPFSLLCMKFLLCGIKTHRCSKSFRVCAQQIWLIHCFAGQVGNSSVIGRGWGLKGGFFSESKVFGRLLQGSLLFSVSLLETDVSRISY